MKTIVKFTILSFVLSWGLWLLPTITKLVIKKDILDQDLFNIFGRFAPSALGLFYLSKKAKILDIIQNTFAITISRYNVFFVFLLMPVLMGVSYLITIVLVPDANISILTSNVGIVVLVYLYVLFLGGPLAEEIGWRGFLAVRLLEKMNPLFASLIIGIVWSLWHLPLFFLPGNVQNDIPFLIYLVYTTVLSVYMILLLMKTKRISSAVYFHTSANVSLGFFYILESTKGLLIMAILFVLYFGIYFYKNWWMLTSNHPLHLEGVHNEY